MTIFLKFPSNILSICLHVWVNQNNYELSIAFNSFGVHFIWIGIIMLSGTEQLIIGNLIRIYLYNSCFLNSAVNIGETIQTYYVFTGETCSLIHLWTETLGKHYTQIRQHAGKPTTLP